MRYWRCRNRIPGGAACADCVQCSGGEPAITRSEAEARFLALVRDVELRPPRTNTRIGRYEVDFHWRTERLVVEVDGYAFHSSRVQFERDRRRDAVLAAHGRRVMRVTWQQIVSEPASVLVRLAQALARSGPA